MSLLAIELNDSGILCASEELIAPASPGYAVLKDGVATLGADAFAQAQLFPRETLHTFWHNLNLEPMELHAGAIKTPADLASAHLNKIVEPYRGSLKQVILAVPASFSPAQLGLLLGICQQGNIPVTGLVDSAVAAVSHPVPGKRMVVIDATNHCVLISLLQVDKGLRRHQVVRLDNIGLRDFSARWANCISDEFVKSTRFDPLHTATSEQWLFDSIPAVIEQISSGKDGVQVDSQNGEYSVTIDRSMLVNAAAGLYQPIVNAITSLEVAGKVTTALFTSRVASLPGLVELVEHNPGFRVVQLSAQAVTRSILKEPELFAHPKGRIALVTKRPWQATPSLVVATRNDKADNKSRNSSQATHVLIDASVYPLGNEHFMLGTSLLANQWGHQVSGVVKGISRQHCSIYRRSGQIIVEDKSTFGTYINGKRVEGSQVAHVGDRVQLGNPGIEVRLIRQVDQHGQS